MLTSPLRCLWRNSGAIFSHTQHELTARFSPRISHCADFAAGGLDTTFYLDDYENWTAPQLAAARAQPNYQLTVESWLEQRSYITNSINTLNASGPHGAFQSGERPI
jgi:hypothetical protein